MRALQRPRSRGGGFGEQCVAVDNTFKVVALLPVVAGRNLLQAVATERDRHSCPPVPPRPHRTPSGAVVIGDQVLRAIRTPPAEGMMSNVRRVQDVVADSTIQRTSTSDACPPTCGMTPR